jgi:iron complex outermembrane receptor protein
VSSQRTAYDNSTQELPGYAVIDATLGYAMDKWLVQFNARNILDRYYFINSYQTLFYGNVIGDPANVSLSVRRQF